MSRATIDDVARLAGVTKSTVSHALSGKRPVSPATRRRIEETIASLGYRPNPLAQRLAAGRAGTIGLVYEVDLSRTFSQSAAVLAAVGAVLSDAGFALVLFPGRDDTADPLRPFLQSGLLDGVLLAQPRAYDERVAALRMTGSPFVMLGRTADNSGLSFVDVDIEAAVEACVEHLARLGHRHIGFLHEDVSAGAAWGRALQAYERACARRRLRLITPVCPVSPDAVRAAARASFGQWPGVTGWIAPDETVAWLVSEEAQVLGRRIPEQLSLLHLSQSGAPGIFQPALTGVDLRPAEQAKQAAELLLEQLHQPGEHDRQVLLDPLWVDGATTAPPAET